MDPERALWTPSAKLISISKPARLPEILARDVTHYPNSGMYVARVYQKELNGIISTRIDLLWESTFNKYCREATLEGDSCAVTVDQGLPPVIRLDHLPQIVNRQLLTAEEARKTVSKYDVKPPPVQFAARIIS